MKGTKKSEENDDLASFNDIPPEVIVPEIDEIKVFQTVIKRKKRVQINKSGRV